MSVYKVIEVIGSSENSWEEAAKTAIEKAGESLSDIRVGEVKELDIHFDEGKLQYRTKVRLSFKLH